jgi:hypothetical protein
VPADLPLRVIRTMVNKALAELGDLFGQMDEDEIKGGRLGIAPEKLPRVMRPQLLYAIRSALQNFSAARE